MLTTADQEVGRKVASFPCFSLKKPHISVYSFPSRNRQFPGRYGRVCLDDHFSTVTTEPDPNKTQGRVLHPDQPRVLSERESARAQGFPDTYEFSCSSSAIRYRQIGNAVPPPLAKQLGLKIMEAMGSSEEEMGSKLSGMKLRGSITLTQTSATGTRTMHGTIFKPNDYEEHNREVTAGFIKYDTYKYNPENSCPAFSGWIFGNDQQNNSPACVGPTPGVEGDREAAGDHSKLDRSMNSYEEAKRRRSRATESRAKQLKLSQEREEKKKARYSAKKDVEREMEKILGHPLFHSHPSEWVKTEARKIVASKGYSPPWLVTEWFGDNCPKTLEEPDGQSSAAIQQTEKLQEEKIHSDLSKNLTTSEEDVVRDFNQDHCMTFEADRDFYTVGGVSNLKMEVSIHHY